MHVRKTVFVAAGLAVLLMGCGSDSGSAKAPNRDQLVAEIVESGGVSQAVAECSADALFSTLSKDDLAKAVGGGEPSTEGKDAFTTAILDCLEVSNTVITDAPTTDAPTTEAPTTVAPTTVAPTTVAPTTVAPTTVVAADGTVSQFASTAKATSEFGDDEWSAKQATGAPTIKVCGDNTEAWASLTSDGKDALNLGYATPVVASMVKISQSYNPGQIVKVEVLNTAGTATVIYQGVPAAMDPSACPNIMELPVADVADVNSVRITVDQSVIALGWTEIDAVELIGTPA